MKLSNFPYLIQKEILDCLSINNLSFLSQCSKNTKNIIQQTQKYRLAKIKSVHYSIHEERRYTSAEVAPQNPNILMYSIYSKTDFPRNPHGKVIEEVRVNQQGAENESFRYRTKKSDAHAKYSGIDNRNLESIIETIHDPLYNLLGSHAMFSLETRDGTHSLPMLRNIGKLEIAGDGFSSRKINKFLDQSTCLEYFSWGTFDERRRILRENSKINDLDTLYLDAGRNLATDVMKRFNGRHAFLSGKDVTATDVVQFLNAWKSGEKFSNLEVISIDSVFNIQQIRDSMDFKHLDKDVIYLFSRKFREPDSSLSTPWEFKSHLYIVRESDGHVASVMLTDERIFMGVWNMTEEEFLEKFQ